LEAAAQNLTAAGRQILLPIQAQHWGLAALLGAAVAAFGASPAYFPQSDTFSYYQIFHYLYSALYFHGGIPLWEPYASYGIPSAFELAFSIGPTKALVAVLGLLFHASDIKFLYFLGMGLDFMMLSLAAMAIVQEAVPGNRLAVLYVALAMVSLHYGEWSPNFGYGFCQPVLLVLLFIIRFFRTYDGVYIALCGLTLIAFTFGSPQYFIIIEGYVGALFGLCCAYVRRNELSQQALRRALRTFFSLRSIVVLLVAAGLALALWQIDKDVLSFEALVAPGRDAVTLKVPLDIYLSYAPMHPMVALTDMVTGKPFNWDVMFYIGLTGFLLLIFATLHCRRDRLAGPLLVCLAAIVAFALPNQFPVAEWAYRFAPGMDDYRHVQYSLVFAKPFAIILIAIAIANIGEKGIRGARAATLVWIGVPLLFFAVVACIETAQRDNELGAVALICLALLVVSVIWADRRPGNARYALALLAMAAVIEPVAHRVLLDWGLAARTELIRQSLPGGPKVEDWYRYPRALAYQPERRNVDLPPVPVVWNAVLYHGLWSFVGVDPCVPFARSDSYGKWVGQTLEGSGIPAMALAWGLFALPRGDVYKAFACESPKLTFEGDATAQILPTRFSANEIAVTVDASAPGLLTYSDAYHPSWKVAVDGSSQPALRTEFGFKAVALSAGVHHVVWTFEPSMNAVVLGSLGTVLAGLAPMFLLLAVPQVGRPDWICIPTNP